MTRARRRTFFCLFFSLALAFLLIPPLTSSPPSLAEEPRGWYPQDSGTSVHLTAAEAADEHTAWVTGYNGTILKTTDGGAEPPLVPEITSITPTSGHPLSTASLGGSNFGSLSSPESYGRDSWLSLGTRIVPLNNILEWQEGAILFRIPADLSPGPVEVSVTVNGVTSNKVAFTVMEPPTRGWRLQDPGTNAILFSVSAADADTAWAVGMGGTILKTTDGGNTWRQQDSGVTNNLWAVAAASPRVAWAGGEEALLLTVDGGATWRMVSSQPGYCVYDIAAVDENNCWVVGGGLPNASLDRGFIIRTRDGGTSWEVQVLNHHHNLYSIAAVDGATAWVAGGEIMLMGTTGVILRTTDGGTNWASSGPTDRSWCRIAAYDAQNAMVWGTMVEGSVPSVKINPECRKTADGGASWTTLNPAQTASIYVPYSGAEMLNPKDIWVASSAGWPPYTGIARTVNGGVSWSYQLDDYLSYPHVQTTDISAVDGDTAWAVGGYMILHTTDGGYGGPAPVIHSLSPASGGSYDLVTIEGANFGSSQERSTVIFRDRPASVESWTDTRIVCRAPEMGAPNLRVPVFVTTSNGTSNSVHFNYGTGFMVLSIQPDQSSQLTFSLNATIEGSGFLPEATVRLEKGAAVITATGVNVASESRIECALVTWGAEPGSYDVVVTNPDGSEARLAGGFTVSSPCGTGSGTALLSLGLAMGLLSLAGSRHARKKRTRPPRGVDTGDP
ncbi:MAG: IPT/TIG domain-containing protein [Actinobacteria bacterium]|nr:IPT/TIG domain-containing protein [Actinomycetota bacterium]